MANYMNAAKIMGVATVVSGCLFANSFIKKDNSTAEQQLADRTTEYKTVNPLNDSRTTAAMLALGLVCTGAFARKALKK